MSPPDVTVVIPTRDRFDLLATAALPSALRQSGVRIEVLVVDDGSRSDAGAVEAFSDPRVRVVRHEDSQGVAAARNTGIREAAAPWVAFLDDDDHWAPTKLATQLEAVHASGSAFAYGSVLVVDGAGRPTDVMDAPQPDGLRDGLLRQNVVPAGSSNVIASTELVRAVGGFDEDLAYLADWDLWLRLAFAGRPAACGEILVAYVRHAGGMRLDARTAIRELEQLRTRHAAVGFAPDGGRYLSWVAGQHRRAGRRRAAVWAYLLAMSRYRDPRWLMQIVATPFDPRGIGLRNRLLRRGPTTRTELSRPQWVP